MRLLNPQSFEELDEVQQSTRLGGQILKLDFMIIGLNGKLTNEQFRCLSSDVQQVIDRDFPTARQFFGLVFRGHEVPFELIQGISALVIKEFLNHVSEVEQLLDYNEISFKELLELGQEMRAELYLNNDALDILVEEKIPLKKILEQDKNIRAELYKAASAAKQSTTC